MFSSIHLQRLRCQRKQPCKLFTVRKRQEFIDEVNINALCQCPKGHHCPSHHTQSGVIAGETFLEDNIQTYSGYCMVNDWVSRWGQSNRRRLVCLYSIAHPIHSTPPFQIYKTCYKIVTRVWWWFFLRKSLHCCHRHYLSCRGFVF